MSRETDVENNFDDYESPYLFEKHMKREKIIFEQYSLVFKSND